MARLDRLSLVGEIGMGHSPRDHDPHDGGQGIPAYSSRGGYGYTKISVIPKPGGFLTNKSSKNNRPE
jgi:hypothetical protein